jgi:Rrf2 family transcriptional regulator, iron-sulfur cluster assembly transcription factor
MFSKSCIYGILATLYIAKNSHNKSNIGLQEIAKAKEIPVHFLSKVLQLLVKNKILKSTRGLNGGFSLNKKASELNLMGVINAIDGEDIFKRCIIDLKDCSKDNPCAIHDQYRSFQEEFMRVFTDKNIENIIADFSNKVNS